MTLYRIPVPKRSRPVLILIYNLNNVMDTTLPLSVWICFHLVKFPYGACRNIPHVEVFEGEIDVLKLVLLVISRFCKLVVVSLTPTLPCFCSSMVSSSDSFPSVHLMWAISCTTPRMVPWFRIQFPIEYFGREVVDMCIYGFIWAEGLHVFPDMLMDVNSTKVYCSYCKAIIGFLVIRLTA